MSFCSIEIIDFDASIIFPINWLENPLKNEKKDVKSVNDVSSAKNNHNA